MGIAFDLTDEVPTRATAKDITTNDYWPIVEASMKSGKVAKFIVPQQDGDDFKKATVRCRGQLTLISDHIKRTIRSTFVQTDDGEIHAKIWVMDRKITQTRKKDTSHETVSAGEPNENAPDVKPETKPETAPKAEPTATQAALNAEDKRRNTRTRPGNAR